MWLQFYVGSIKRELMYELNYEISKPTYHANLVNCFRLGLKRY